MEHMRTPIRHPSRSAAGRIALAFLLSLPLLASRLTQARERLAHQRLTPAMLSARHSADRQRLDATTRVMASLNPDNVLKRGYVRVTGADGRTLVARDMAAAEAALTLHFRDGQLGVAVQDGAPRPARAAPQKPRPPIPEQGKLL